MKEQVRNSKRIKHETVPQVRTKNCLEKQTPSDTAKEEVSEMKIEFKMKKSSQSAGETVKALLKQEKILSAAESSSACTGSFNISQRNRKENR